MSTLRNAVSEETIPTCDIFCCSKNRNPSRVADTQPLDYTKHANLGVAEVLRCCRRPISTRSNVICNGVSAKGRGGLVDEPVQLIKEQSSGQIDDGSTNDGSTSDKEERNRREGELLRQISELELGLQQSRNEMQRQTEVITQKEEELKTSGIALAKAEQDNRIAEDLQKAAVHRALMAEAEAQRVQPRKHFCCAIS